MFAFGRSQRTTGGSVCPGHSWKDENKVLPVGGDPHRLLPSHAPVSIPVVFVPVEFARRYHRVDDSFSRRKIVLKFCQPVPMYLGPYQSSNSGHVTLVANHLTRLRGIYHFEQLSSARLSRGQYEGITISTTHDDYRSLLAWRWL